MKKLILCILLLVLLTGCSKKMETTKFQKMYGIESSLIVDSTYDDFKKSISNKAVVFIGDDSDLSKRVANIFSASLCECDVNKGYYLNKSDITDKELMELFGLDNFKCPIIGAFKDGKLVGYYNESVQTDNIGDYVTDIILKAYPTVCNEAC